MNISGQISDSEAQPNSLRTAETPRMTLEEFFTLALRQVSALSELHAQGLIHGNWAVDVESSPRANRRDSLVYASPEQTGRMNRAVDYRSDFYSLGVVLYEWLTGEPPFLSDDSLELIHWHIAKTPPSPAEFDPAIPRPLSRLVMKLLAKTAEDRYQSALGLKADLERCANEWESDRNNRGFSVGRTRFPRPLSGFTTVVWPRTGS